MDHKSAIAAAVNSPRFRIDDCIDFEASLAPAQAQEYAIIKRKLTPKEFKAFRRSIIRNSFLIEDYQAIPKGRIHSIAQSGIAYRAKHTLRLEKRILFHQNSKSYLHAKRVRHPFKAAGKVGA